MIDQWDDTHVGTKYFVDFNKFKGDANVHFLSKTKGDDLDRSNGSASCKEPPKLNFTHKSRLDNKCEKCDYVTIGRVADCVKCSNPRPKWICLNCHATVYGTRPDCHRCRTMKGEEANKSNWVCTGCSVLVWGSKIACFRCNTPKNK